VVGVIHGLAGSAALALLVLTTIQDAVQAVLYLAVFGLGTVIGMVLLTGAVALPFAAASRRFTSFERWLAGVTGLTSIVLGIALGYEIGFVEGLFS
jgi:high-affinity nickel-transport protein